jgi:hypothetical protein
MALDIDRKKRLLRAKSGRLIRQNEETGVFYFGKDSESAHVVGDVAAFESHDVEIDDEVIMDELDFTEDEIELLNSDATDKEMRSLGVKPKDLESEADDHAQKGFDLLLSNFAFVSFMPIVISIFIALLVYLLNITGITASLSVGLISGIASGIGMVIYLIGVVVFIVKIWKMHKVSKENAGAWSNTKLAKILSKLRSYSRFVLFLHLMSFTPILAGVAFLVSPILMSAVLVTSMMFLSGMLGVTIMTVINLLIIGYGIYSVISSLVIRSKLKSL